MHYEFDAHCIRYFGLQAERAAGDAGLIQAALTSLLPLVRPLALVRQAESALRHYWELLDGLVEAAS
jgi:hypothetical protein